MIILYWRSGFSLFNFGLFFTSCLLMWIVMVLQAGLCQRRWRILKSCSVIMLIYLQAILSKWWSLIFTCNPFSYLYRKLGKIFFYCCKFNYNHYLKVPKRPRSFTLVGSSQISNESTSYLMSLWVKYQPIYLPFSSESQTAHSHQLHLPMILCSCSSFSFDISLIFFLLDCDLRFL